MYFGGLWRAAYSTKALPCEDPASKGLTVMAHPANEFASDIVHTPLVPRFLHPLRATGARRLILGEEFENEELARQISRICCRVLLLEMLRRMTPTTDKKLYPYSPYRLHCTHGG